MEKQKIPVEIIEAVEYVKILNMASRLMDLTMSYRQNVDSKSRKDSVRKLVEQSVGKDQWRKVGRIYKNIGVTACLNPAYPQEVIAEILAMLKNYQVAINFLGLRRPKEEKRRKPALPKKPSDYPSKIIQRCQTKIKRQVGKYLRGKDCEKQRIAIWNILAEEFEKLREAIKKMRLGTRSEGLEYIDAMQRSVNIDGINPLEYERNTSCQYPDEDKSVDDQAPDNS